MPSSESSRKVSQESGQEPSQESGKSVCIIPSEALDVDALASALLFAELWQCLGPKEIQREAQASGEQPLAKLRGRYAGHALSCCLPLAPEHKYELLWRQDIASILEFIAVREAGALELSELSEWDAFATLQDIFGACRVDCSAVLCPAAGYVLLDCHSLPHLFRADEAAVAGKVADKVLAIWDHRPDTGSFASAPLRCVQKATSCVALLLDLAVEFGVVGALSVPCCLFALAALLLDQQQYGALLPEEQQLWQSVEARLLREAEGEVLSPALLEQFCQRVLHKRNQPSLGLFEQANCDVKFWDFWQGLGQAQAQAQGQGQAQAQKLRVAIGVLGAPLSALQDLCEAGDLPAFMARCCVRQQVDFFVLLHRQSAQNPSRALSFCFTKDWPSGFWSPKRVECFLRDLQQLLPCVVCYSGASFGPKQAFPLLVQLRQLDSSISRKGFMPIFTEVFSGLLEGG